MKKLLTVLLCICLLCAHSVTALAESQPNFEDFATAEEYEAAYLAWYAAEVERAAQENAVPESEDTAHEPVSDAPAPPHGCCFLNDRYPLGQLCGPFLGMSIPPLAASVAACCSVCGGFGGSCAAGSYGKKNY